MNEEEVLFGNIETSNVLELWFDEEEKVNGIYFTTKLLSKY